MKKMSYILLMVPLSIYLQACGTKSDFKLSPEDLYNSGELQVITSWYNDKRQTISVLYGNGQAMNSTDSIHYAGEQYMLVTWHQQANPLWFGGQINGRIACVEQVDITTSTNGDIRPIYSVKYRENSDSVSSGTPREQDRIDYILTRRKARLT